MFLRRSIWSCSRPSLLHLDTMLPLLLVSSYTTCLSFPQQDIMSSGSTGCPIASTFTRMVPISTPSRKISLMALVASSLITGRMAILAGAMGHPRQTQSRPLAMSRHTLILPTHPERHSGMAFALQVGRTRRARFQKSAMEAALIQPVPMATSLARHFSFHWNKMMWSTRPYMPVRQRCLAWLIG